MEFNLQSWVHKKCDYKPNKLIIIKSTNRNVFRGYTDQSWSGNGIYKADQNALIFSFINKLNHPLTIGWSNNNGIIYNSLNGALFGSGSDLSIADEAVSFHTKCDSKPNTLIIIKSTNGNVFGGYTEHSWSGNRVVKADPNSFIFSSINKLNKPLKMKPSKNNGIYCRSSHGPMVTLNKHGMVMEFTKLIQIHLFLV
jgi:hypothetical protein